MEETKDKNGHFGYPGHPDGCKCMMHGSKHHLLRLAFLIIVLAVTFSLGVKFGELKAFMGYGYFGGHRMMMGGYGGGWSNQYVPNGYYPGMMRQGYNGAVPQASGTVPQSQ